MEQLLDDIRNQQKETWNKFAPGWKKWDKLTIEFLQPMGDEMIRQLDPKGKDVVLDLASGTGEPGLTIASMLEGGKVVIADLSEGMLAVAREHAENRGITNIETVVCDGCDLPFADNTFDAISCRFGFMFFPDMLMATQEMRRVLKPEGKISIAVWGAPEKNFWVTAIMGTIKEHMALPAPLPDAPGMFRCAEDGLMVSLFSQAGLKNVTQKEVFGKLNFKTAAEYWDLMSDIGAPVVAALSKADEATREKIQNDVYKKLNQKYADGPVVMDASAFVVYGEK